MPKKILFIVPYPFNKAPSQRLKFEQYYPSFIENGFTITHSSFMSDEMWSVVYKKGNTFKKLYHTIIGYVKRYFLLFSIRNYDVVYVHLWGTPLGIPLYEWFICKLSKKVVYDIDDLIYLGKTSTSNKLISIFKGNTKAPFMMKHADHVLVSTDKLLDFASKLNNNISVIPATIDVSKYNNPVKQASKKVCIGWSGSHSTSKYLHLLDNVLRNIAQKYPIRILVMGDMNFQIEGLANIELLQWHEDKEVEYLQMMDIGLHPLPDEEWVYGKSGGKLVQYMAAGIPIIATAIGPNFKAIKEGYNGFLVNSDDDWFSKLELLINDTYLRNQIGNNSRKTAEAVYSLEANLQKYLNVLRD